MKSEIGVIGLGVMGKSLSRNLAQKGFDPGPADGLMGERTRQAITRFQRESGMTPDGEVTPELLDRLQADAA